MGAAIYMSSVLEYLVAEIMELSGIEAKNNHKKRYTKKKKLTIEFLIIFFKFNNRVNPRHLMLAVRNDVELNELLKDVTFAESGVFPHIENVLLKKKTSSKKKKVVQPRSPKSTDSSASE